MKLRVLNWNVRRAKENSPAWEIISRIDPDLIALQEVIAIPGFIQDHYTTYQKRAVTNGGKRQLFSTAILVKGEIIENLPLGTDFEWVNKELEFFEGNILACTAIIKGLPPIKVVSVYSPAWPVDKARLKDIDVSEVKLKLNPDVWCTEILWAALKSNTSLIEGRWVIAGDFNSSVTFDHLWKGGLRGNQEIIDRMNALGLTECLFSHSGKIIPTFRNPRGGRVVHQLDHMYVTKDLLTALTSSSVGDDELQVFEKSISDHLPIISDFDFHKSEQVQPLRT